MSILIRGASLPKSCNKCKLDLRTDICQAFCEWNAEHPYSIRATDRLPDCPLSEVPEPCEDAVSRKDCLQALSHLMDVEGFRSGWAVSRANVECMLKAMPSVMPKQRMGKWIRNGWAITCSECGYDMPYTVRNFCPNCGAKIMEGDAE